MLWAGEGQGACWIAADSGERKLTMPSWTGNWRPAREQGKHEQSRELLKGGEEEAAFSRAL